MVHKGFTAKEKQVLGRMKKLTKEALRRQTQVGLAKVFTQLRCKGVAKEIKAGRKVVGNVKWGFRHCIHDKVGPRINVRTHKISPQTAHAKSLEKKALKNINLLLENASYPTIPTGFLSDLYRKDRSWISKMKKRKCSHEL